MANTQYVIFKLDGESYGAEIHNIQEIILPQEPTQVPNNPDFIEGIIDYRDEVIPVLDLKKRFRLGSGDYKGQSRFIVAQVNRRNVAFAVDEVTEILRAQEEQIGEAPEMTRISKEYITGVTRVGERLIIMLDLSKVLSVGEQDVIEAMDAG